MANVIDAAVSIIFKMQNYACVFRFLVDFVRVLFLSLSIFLLLFRLFVCVWVCVCVCVWGGSFVCLSSFVLLLSLVGCCFCVCA